MVRIFIQFSSTCHPLFHPLYHPLFHPLFCLSAAFTLLPVRWAWGRLRGCRGAWGRPNRNGPPPAPPWGLGPPEGPGGRPNRNGPQPPPCGLGPSAGPAGKGARTAKGHCRRGACGRPLRAGVKLRIEKGNRNKRNCKKTTRDL